jgi:hypothetical protein
MDGTMDDIKKPKNSDEKPDHPTTVIRPDDASEVAPATEQTAPFHTPEEVAAGDHVDLAAAAETDSTEASTDSKKNDEGRWAALKQWRPTRKQWIIIAAVAVVLIGSGTAFALTRHKAVVPVAKAVPNKPAPVVAPPIVSDLTGLPIASASINQKPVTGVMIENSDQARPQSGLDQAGVVFEAIAEAGITRFLALFQDTAPSYIGPVRSVRPYYLQWCLGFDCAIAHVGGSPDALADIGPWNVKNLDEFYNGSSYQRISSREAPHNVYTSMAQLNALEATKGFGAPTYTGFPRKTDAPAKTATVTTINVNPSSADFASSYTYNPSTNNYIRDEAGAPHLELSASGATTPITPKVVVAMVIPQSQGALDASGAYYTEYATVGSGQAFVFQDGTLTQGTWTKTSNSSQITFANASGTIKFDAGQTWLVAVGTASDVTYK